MVNFNRALCAAAVLLLAIPFIGAAPGTPKPAIVVYPFSGATGVAPAIGANVALVTALQLSLGGDITVKSAPADTQRADYLLTARGLGADYYVSGFVSPIGNQLAVIEQLVSTRNGVSVWRSNTMQLTVPDDARAQASELHDAVVKAGVQQPFPVSQSPSGSNTPPRSSSSRPSKPEAPLPIPRFESIPAPVAAVPTAAPVVRKTALILPFSGSAIAAVKHYVPDALLRTFPTYGISGAKATTDSDDVAAVGLVQCSQMNADVLFSGTIDTSQWDPERGWFFDANLSLKAYDCKNLSLKPRTIETTAMSGNVQTAIDIAIAQALKDYTNPHFVSNR